MGQLMDLTGQKFGRLTVVSRAPNKRTAACWWCRCDCGNPDLIVVIGTHLRNGNTKSCGCLQKEAVIKTNSKKRKYNKYDLTGEYGIGYTSTGKEFYFDLEDYDKIKDYCWSVNGKGYITTGAGKNHKKMHNIILPTADGCMPDHIHGKESRNDNRKSNLRPVTKSQNQMNMALKSNNTSGVTGVSFDNTRNKWIVRLQKDEQPYYIGAYDNFDDAVKARKDAERKYFGEYSYDNSQLM